MDNREQSKKPNWGSLIGWLIFFLVIAGGPLLNALQGALGGAVRIPSGMLPLIILGLVILSAIVSVLRAIGGRGENERASSRMPTYGAQAPFDTTPYMPQTPFDAAPHLPSSLPQTYHSPRGKSEIEHSAPRFDPVISPLGIAAGVIGMIVLAGVALVVFGAFIP